MSSPSEEAVVREFFELFKTPWEFYRKDGTCTVRLHSGYLRSYHDSAEVVIIYSPEKTPFDELNHIDVEPPAGGNHISILGNAVRACGKTARFSSAAGSDLRLADNDGLVFARRIGQCLYIRVGYNLFGEVEALLSGGQPSVEAQVPALDLHIALLRNLMTAGGVSVVEIPPSPAGYSFAACLTHDLDHASIRRHGLDATVGGFVYRATLGSIVNLFRGRLSLRGVLTNWVAAAKLPFTQLGLASDFWRDFDRYLRIEKGRPSTFFIIPFENRPGRHVPSVAIVTGNAPSARGARYDVGHIADKLPPLQAAGCEIGLHGIDAWADSGQGEAESQRISTFSGQPVRGVRMHWLYGDTRTPAALENAGFSYDSTAGYNETVGYRAGTAQPFKLPGAKRLLELPLLVMDTALFYPDYMNLSFKSALVRLRPMLDHAAALGGTFTVNWHDRSIAPERLWGGFYETLIDEMTKRNAWFCTGAQATEWFRKRRSAIFERDGEGRLVVRVPAESDRANLPGLKLRVYGTGDKTNAPDYTDTSFSTILKVEVHSDRATKVLKRS